MTDIEIPDVEETDLTREEMEEAAQECGIDPDGLDDQQLLEQLGVALGELDESQLSAAHEEQAASPGGAEDADGDGSGGGEADHGEADHGEADSDDADSETGGDGDAEVAGGDEEGRGMVGALRSKVASTLADAAGRLMPDGTDLDAQRAADEEGTDATGDEDTDEGSGDPAEQRVPGEPIEGPTRDELREHLRELGLPVTGTKDELQQRLDEAQGGTGEGDGEGPDGAGDGDDEGAETTLERVREKVARSFARTSELVADDGDGAGEHGEEDDDGARLRDRLADRLDGVADKLRGSGEPEDGGHDVGDAADTDPSTLKLVGQAVRRKLPGG